jgi:hypothetical protein
VSTKFFSHLARGGTRSAAGAQRFPGGRGADLEEQQALLLSALRRAAGTPVTYAELRDAGIEFPASVVSELELGGFPIERSYGVAPSGRRVVGVRLDPSRDYVEPDAPSGIAEHPTESKPRGVVAQDESRWDAVRVYRTSARGAFVLALLEWLSRFKLRPSRAETSSTQAGGGRTLGTVARSAAPIVLVATIAAVSAFILAGLTGGGGHSRSAISNRPPSGTVGASGGPHSARHTRPAAPIPPTPVSPVLATDLEARGHGLLAGGRYGDAVSILRRAVLATGERISACLEPNSGACLTYAYALYDLGRALRLSGDTSAAVPILERRLRIDNQRAVVQAELQLARQGVS